MCSQQANPCAAAQASRLALLKTQIAKHNQLLQQLASSFPTQHAGSSAFYYDIGTSFAKVLEVLDDGASLCIDLLRPISAILSVQVAGNPAAYGFSNTQQACYVTAPDLSQNSVPDAQPIGLAGGTLCSNPSIYLFWDQ